MQTPAITFSQFAILSLLMDGEPKTPLEIYTKLNLPTTKITHYRELTRNLLQHDMIKTFDLPLQRKKGRVISSPRAILIITKHGRHTWRETLDYVLFFFKQTDWKPDRSTEDSESIRQGLQNGKERPPTSRKPTKYRHPNEDELRQILYFTSDEFVTF